MFEDNAIVEAYCFSEGVGETPLPDELLAEIIFQHIPLCQWSSTFAFVSKQFRRCVRIAYSRVKSMNLRKLFSLNPTIENYEGKLNRILCKSPVKLNNILTSLLTVCPNLTEMDGFKDITPSLEVNTWNILKKFRRLESIVLDGVGFEFQNVVDFVVSCKNLKNLSITNCSIHVIDYCSIFDIGSLTRLVLYNNKSKQFQLENFSEKLTSLTLDGFLHNISRNCDMENLMINCTNLEAFSIRIHNNVDYNLLFKTLPNFCKLTRLCVTGNMHALENGFCPKFCAWLDTVKNQLEHIEMHDAELNENGYNLFTKCLNLHSLILSGSSTRAIYAIEKFPPLPEALKKFRISPTMERLEQENNYLLMPKVLKLSNLTDLYLLERTHFSGFHLKEICNMESLKNLRLCAQNTFNINDSLFEMWNEKNSGMFDRLVSLELPRCNGISDVGACLLAKKAVNLEVLNLELARISDTTILLLADVAKKLRKANFIQNGDAEPFLNRLVDWSVIGEKLIGEKAILYLIEKAVCLKQLKINKTLASKVLRSRNFLPFVEDVEILTC